MLRAIASLSTTPLPSSSLIHFNAAKRHKPFKLHNPTSNFRKNPLSPSNFTTRIQSSSGSFHFSTHPEITSDGDWEFLNEEFEEDDDEGCPWEGAVMYKRDASVSHLEYCTTLERLGLGKLSSEVSRSRASEMGLRVVKSVKDYPNGSPVLISVDVARSKQKLRLDGIVRTVIALRCNRCGEPAAQSVYSDFSLLLCDEPIEEQDTIDMGIIFGDKSKNLAVGEEEEDDALIDLDDRLYFPLDQKIIDISKNIRDLIHVEITISALCSTDCLGLCLQCGMNLNTSRCSCKSQKVEEKGYGPLGDLRKQIQQT